MLNRGVWPWLGVLTLTLAGCGSGNFEEAKQANEATITAFEEILAALEGVNSPDDVDAAASRIDQVTDNLRSSLVKVKDLKITKNESEQL